VTAWRGGQTGAADQPGQGAVDASLSREPHWRGHAAPGRVEPEVLAGGNVNDAGAILRIQCTTGMRFADGLLQRSGYCQDGGRGAEDIILGLEAPEAEEWLVPV
jgi:hypothetical protein